MNPNRYRRTLDAMKPAMMKPGVVLADHLGNLSQVSHVPIVVVMLYANRADVLGPRADLEATIAGLIAYYQYTNIDAWDDLV